MKYTVSIINNGAENTFATDSRDSVKHLRNHGGQKAIVMDNTGKIVSMAQRGEDDKPYRCTVDR